MIVNQSKDSPTVELLNQNELGVVRAAKAKISRKVLENAPHDGFEEEVPNFNKRR